MKCLLRHELDALLAAAKSESTSDYLMFLVIFNHGLRASEAIALSNENLLGNCLVVQRLKRSMKTSQPLLDSERDYLLALPAGRWFPMTRMTLWRRMQYYGAKANLDLSRCHPHALKHSAGRLAYLGGMGLPELQTYLGHRVGSNTMIYAQASEGEAASAFAAAVGK